MTPRVLGLDLSLTGTGYALPDGTPGLLRPGKLRGCERLIHLRRQIVAMVQPMHLSAGPVPTIDLVAVEGYSFGSRASQAHSLGELGGVIRVALHEAGVAFVEVSPATLKKYATGAGNAAKNAVLAAAITRLGYGGSDDNEADALWLRAVGMALLGAPVVGLPKTHLVALDALRTKAAA